MTSVILSVYRHRSQMARNRDFILIYKTLLTGGLNGEIRRYVKQVFFCFRENN